jgi:TRAP-type mannitol/chloroaromatic compound transport system substrate-binding protein
MMDWLSFLKWACIAATVAAIAKLAANSFRENVAAATYNKFQIQVFKASEIVLADEAVRR